MGNPFTKDTSTAQTGKRNSEFAIKAGWEKSQPAFAMLKEKERMDQVMDGETRAEFDRVHDEDNRQNHRLEVLEENFKQIHTLSLSVQRLADSMERMLQEQTRQGEQLKKLEDKPAEAWGSMRKTVFNALLGALCSGVVLIVGALFVYAVQHLI